MNIMVETFEFNEVSVIKEMNLPNIFDFNGKRRVEPFSLSSRNCLYLVGFSNFEVFLLVSPSTRSDSFLIFS